MYKQAGNYLDKMQIISLHLFNARPPAFPSG